MLRNVLFVLRQPRKDVPYSSGVLHILNPNHKLPKQSSSIRYINNHKIKYENLSFGSVSRTIICHKYLRLVKSAIRGNTQTLVIYLVEMSVF